MGQTAGKPHHFSTLLHHLFKVQGLSVSHQWIEACLQTVVECNPWFPDEGSFDLEIWQWVRECWMSHQTGKKYSDRFLAKFSYKPCPGCSKCSSSANRCESKSLSFTRTQWNYWLDGREFEWTPGVGDGPMDFTVAKYNKLIDMVSDSIHVVIAL